MLLIAPAPLYPSTMKPGNMKRIEPLRLITLSAVCWQAYQIITAVHAHATVLLGLFVLLANQYT